MQRVTVAERGSSYAERVRRTKALMMLPRLVKRCGGFPKLDGYLCGCPYNKGYSMGLS